MLSCMRLITSHIIVIRRKTWITRLQTRQLASSVVQEVANTDADLMRMGPRETAWMRETATVIKMDLF